MDINRPLIKTNCYYGSLTYFTILNEDYNIFQYAHYPLLSTVSSSNTSIDIESNNHQADNCNNKETSKVLFMTANIGNDQNHLDSNRHSNCINECSTENNFSSSLHEFRPSIARALEYCENEVLPTYKMLSILLGWYHFNIECPNCFKILANLLHVIILVLTICIGHILQYVSCFRQHTLGSLNQFDLSIFFKEKSNFPPSLNVYPVKNNLLSNQSLKFNLSQIFLHLNTEFHEEKTIHVVEGQFFLHCRGSMITHYLIPGIIHLISFLIILKHLRFCEVDRFHNLCLLNHLLATKIIGYKKACLQMKKTVRNWIIVIFSCLILIMIQLAFRIFIIDDVLFNFIPASCESLLILFKFVFFFLFAFIELVHISIIIFYALYCQMNIIFTQMNLTAIREKRINFQDFAKNTEIFKMNINFLNNRYSLSVSLLMIYIMTKASAILIDLFSKYVYVDWNIIVLAISSMIYWSILLTIPLLQAARLTNSCQSICDIGHELCARPFCYQQTARDDLDSLLTYTSSLNVKARLLMIPVRPSCIISIIFVLVFILLILSQLQLIDI